MIELRLNEFYAVLALIVMAALVGLGALGQRVTPLSETGEPRFLTWADWRLLQAERAYQAERSVLHDDVADMLELLNAKPNAVAAQMLLERVENHTRSGQASLATARAATLAAANSVRDWTSGVMDRESAVQAVMDALALLQSN